MDRKRVGLALGGGAARGFAHLGVLRVLELAEVPVHCIAGTSVGSVVGALYAAGLDSERLLELALSFRWRQVARLAWPRHGLVSFSKLEGYLTRAIGDVTFSELEVPYAAIAADLATGEQVILTDGSVARAVHASCSIPGIVAPVDLGGRLLVDGGIVNNLPISAVRDLGADVVIAVGLGALPGAHPNGPLRSGIAAIEILIMHAADDPSTAEVHIPIPVWGLASFVRTSGRHRLIALGRQAAEQALPAIRDALS
ncbi:patatin-like phospholipase family protein [Chloroflexota bacterium]